MKSDSVVVSAVIPVRNEFDSIARTVNALQKQNLSGLLEILVVDGCSTDGSREIVKNLAATDPRIRLLENSGGFTAQGMNIGLRAATGNFIAIIGGHTEIAPDYLQRAYDLLQSTDAACVGGVIQSVGNTRWGKAIALAQSSPFGVGTAFFRYGQTMRYADAAAFGVYRREVFNKVGGFDEELIRNQDDEFDLRLRQAGYKILLCPEMKVKYWSRASFLKAFSQYFQYGFWKIRVWQKRRQFASWRALAPITFILFWLGIGIGGVFNQVLLSIGGIVLILYFLAGLGFGIFHRRRDDITQALLSPFAFATLHFSYGLGFLYGLIWFVVLDRVRLMAVKMKG